MNIVSLPFLSRELSPPLHIILNFNNSYALLQKNHVAV